MRGRGLIARRAPTIHASGASAIDRRVNRVETFGPVRRGGVGTPTPNNPMARTPALSRRKRETETWITRAPAERPPPPLAPALEGGEQRAGELVRDGAGPRFEPCCLVVYRCWKTRNSPKIVQCPNPRFSGWLHSPYHYSIRRSDRQRVFSAFKILHWTGPPKVQCPTFAGVHYAYGWRARGEGRRTEDRGRRRAEGEDEPGELTARVEIERTNPIWARWPELRNTFSQFSLESGSRRGWDLTTWTGR
jgi:hypothetical protein